MGPMRAKRRVLPLLILILGGCMALLVSPAWARAPRPTPKPLPHPGQSLETYLKEYPELHRTGGIAAKHLKPGFTLEIFEGTRGEEKAFSESYLPCDPSDPSDTTVVPRTAVLAIRSPDGRRFVLSETRQEEFHGLEELDDYMAEREKEAHLRNSRAKSPLELLTRLYRRTLLREKGYRQTYTNDKVLVYHSIFDEGAIGSLLLIPDWNNALPEALPEGVVPGGVRMRIDYVMQYEKLALGPLLRYVHGRQREAKSRRRH